MEGQLGLVRLAGRFPWCFQLVGDVLQIVSERPKNFRGNVACTMTSWCHRHDVTRPAFEAALLDDPTRPIAAFAQVELLPDATAWTTW